jgi:MFS family permease
VLRWRNVGFFLTVRFLSTVAMQVQAVGVAWHVYEVTQDPLALGYVGLAQFVPMFAFGLPAGDVADRYNRGHVLALSYIVQAITSLLLLVMTLTGEMSEYLIYSVLVIFGTARAFSGPAGQSFIPLLVPIADLPRAVAWSTSSFHVAVIVGPAVGGFAIEGGGPVVAYAACLVFFIGAALAISLINVKTPKRSEAEGTTRERVIAGIAYVRSKPMILGAISLDLFAVLLGGVTALLPIFAKDILQVGADGFGLLRSGPAIGASVISILLGIFPLQRHAGPWLFASVALFGVATIIFGLSENYWLSLLMLITLGAADMISVYVRISLVQIATPDEMRGRVSAVSLMFINASNELGEFESGVLARLMGTVPSVVFGGFGTLGIVALWAWLFPDLRKIDRLSEIEPQLPDEKPATR